jgi:hypothetical protein
MAGLHGSPLGDRDLATTDSRIQISSVLKISKRIYALQCEFCTESTTIAAEELLRLGEQIGELEPQVGLK